MRLLLVALLACIAVSLAVEAKPASTKQVMNAKTTLKNEVSWQAIALAIARNSCRSGIGKLASKNQKLKFFPCKKRTAPYNKGAKYSDKAKANLRDTHSKFVRRVLRMKCKKKKAQAAHADAHAAHAPHKVTPAAGDPSAAFSLLQVSDKPSRPINGDAKKKCKTACCQWRRLTKNDKGAEVYNHAQKDLYLLQFLETKKIRGVKPKGKLLKKLKRARAKIVGLLARALRKIAKKGGVGRKTLVKKLKKKAKSGARTLLPLLSCVKSGKKKQLKHIIANLMNAAPKTDAAASAVLRSVIIKKHTHKFGADLARYAVNSIFKSGASYAQLTFQRKSLPRKITKADKKPRTANQKRRDTLYRVLADKEARKVAKMHMFLKLSPKIFALAGEPKINKGTRTVSSKTYFKVRAARGEKDKEAQKPYLPLCSAKRVRARKVLDKKTGKPKKGPLHFDANKFASRMHHSFIRGVDFSASERYCVQNTKATRTVLRSVLNTLNKEASVRGRRMMLHVELGHGAKAYNKRKIFNAAGEFLPDRKAKWGMTGARLLNMCSAIKVKPSGLNGLPVHWSWRFSKRKNKFVRMNQAGVLGRSNLRAMLSALEKIFKKWAPAKRAAVQKNVIIRFGRPYAVNFKSARRMKKLRIHAVLSLSKKAKAALHLASKPKYLYKYLRSSAYPTIKTERGTFLDDFMVIKSKKVNGTKVVKRSVAYSTLIPHIRKFQALIRLRASKVRVNFGSYGSGLSGGRVKNAVKIAKKAIKVFKAAAAQCAKDGCTKKSLKAILKGKKHTGKGAPARASYALFRPRFFRKLDKALARRKITKDVVLKGLGGLNKGTVKSINAMRKKASFNNKF